MFELDTAQPSSGHAGTLRRTSVNTLSVLTSTFANCGAHRILDVGCGDGTIAEALHGQGFSLTGIDPSALVRARQCLPMAKFHCPSAEALSADLGSFEAAYFVISLHHVAPGQMQAALLAAISVVSPRGIVLVIEPLAQGSFFRARRSVEDETLIRAQATSATEALISTGQVELRDLRRWNCENHTTGLKDFIAYLGRVLPERAEIARRKEAAMARAWRNIIRNIDGMTALIQPMVCWTLAAAQEPRR